MTGPLALGAHTDAGPRIIAITNDLRARQRALEEALGLLSRRVERLENRATDDTDLQAEIAEVRSSHAALVAAMQNGTDHPGADAEVKEALNRRAAGEPKPPAFVGTTHRTRSDADPFGIDAASSPSDLRGKDHHATT